jgi:hypothetical protein
MLVAWHKGLVIVPQIREMIAFRVHWEAPFLATSTNRLSNIIA